MTDDQFEALDFRRDICILIKTIRNTYAAENLLADFLRYDMMSIQEKHERIDFSLMGPAFIHGTHQ